MLFLSSSLPRKSSGAVGFLQSSKEFPPWGKIEVGVAVWVFESSWGRGPHLQCILLLHPCATWVLSPHSLGTSLGHPVISIFPFLAHWQQTDCTWREEMQHYSECLWKRKLIQQPQCPRYQTPKGSPWGCLRTAASLGTVLGLRYCHSITYLLPCLVAQHILDQL